MNVSDPTVFVVDDDPSILKSLSRLLQAAGHTVATFTSAEDFLDDCNPDMPGCLLLDLAMPGLNGLELQKTLAARGCKRPIVFLSGRASVPSSVQAMKGGATDFLTKPVSEDTLLEAIDEAMERDAAMRRHQAEVADFRHRWASLTPRECEVAQHVMAGRLNKQIANHLGTVERTVKFHRSHVMSKLNVGSVAELVRLAERADLQND
jgi:FixJ family two-component response regulator